MNTIPISDFILAYPYKKSKEFNNSIEHLKEFYELKADENSIIDNSNKKVQENTRWKHQELNARYAGPNTAFNEELMYHTPGTGKTCGAIAVVEDTFKKQIAENRPLKKALIIVPNEALENQWKEQIAFRCSSGDYIPEHYFSEDPETKLTELEKTKRLNKLINEHYIIKTKDSFGNAIKKMSDRQIQQIYNNIIVIIDEAHNLKDKDKKKDYYNDYHRFLHLISGKKLLLTGTPMVDQANEIAGLLNLILPLDQQLETGSNFDKEYLTKTVELQNKDKLIKRLRGYISYINAGGNFPKRIDKGETVWTDYIKSYVTDMSDIQLQGYKKAFEKDKKQKKGFYDNSAEAINFVYYDNINNTYLWGKEAGNLLMNKTGKSYKLNPKYSNDLLKNLKKYSSKLYTIYKIAKRFPQDPIFLYNNRVSGASGAIFQGLILNALGIKTRVITGDETGKQKGDIRKIFNSPENRKAEKIQIIIGTKTISEGTSFTTARRSISISPWWNSAVTEQAISRAIRADSLDWLDSADRKIYVYQLAATHKDLDSDKNVDAKRFRVSEDKDIEIKAVDRFLKEIAWDCSLNYARNFKDGVENSRDCDFQSCSWKCEGIEENNVPNDKIARSNWRILYSKSERENIEILIRNLFQKYSVIKLNDLAKTIEKDEKLVLLVLESFIKNNVKVLSKLGLECYIRVSGEYLYLSDNLNNNQVSDVFYIENPFINSYRTLSDIIDDKIFKEESEKLKCDFSNLKELSLNTQAKIVENMYNIYLKTEDEKIKEKLGNFYIIDEVPVHTVLKQELPIDYIDFTIGRNGEIRCYKDSKWENCEGKEGIIISKKIKETKDITLDKNITENKYKAYVVFTAKGMKIADIKKQEEELAKLGKKRDDRKKFTGQMCSSWKKHQLIPLIMRLTDLKHPDLKSFDENSVTKFVNARKVVSKNPKEVSNTLCYILETFFREKGLYLQE